MNIDLKKKLQSLELSDFVEAIESQENNISYVDKTFEERLNDICETVATIRYNKLVAKLIKNAEFKYPQASIESLNFDLREITKETFSNLASMRFLESASNITVTGPTGSGKTYISCVLGVEACKRAYRVYYIRLQNLFKRLDELQGNVKDQKRYLKRLSNYSLLIIDEWLIYKLSDKEVKFVYELMELRAERNSTIFVSQFSVDEWHERLGGGIQADSIMDRIVHNNYEIPPTTENIRKKYDSEKINKLIDEIESK